MQESSLGTVPFSLIVSSLEFANAKRLMLADESLAVLFWRRIFGNEILVFHV